MEIIKSEVEGDLTLRSGQLLVRECKKVMLFWILSILTCGIFPLICYYKTSLRKKMAYSVQSHIETSTHVFVLATNGSQYIEKLYFSSIQGSSIKLIFFVNRKMKYIYHDEVKAFSALQFDVEGKQLIEIANSQPLDNKSIDYKIDLYGESFIDIKVPSYFKYFQDQLLQPINFLFYFGMIVLLLQQFLLFFIIALVAQFLIISIIYIFVRMAKKQLRKACLHDIPIQVKRQDGIITVSSNKLVPGDIFIITEPITLPFDCILLEGQLQVNESNITGETIPVIKSSLPLNSDFQFKYENQKSQVVLEGTTIIKMELSTAKALVVRTNYSSFKGQIIRSLMFPKKFDSRFYVQGLKFCLLMIILCSIGYFSILYKMDEIGITNYLKSYRFLDMIQFCAPPAVPIIINIMIFFGLIRLKNKKIIGSYPMKQIQAGRVQTICFDKTGTLTENFVEIIGYSQPDDSNLMIVQQSESSLNDKIVDKILGICHQASINDQVTMVGDPIDIQMVQFSGWTIGHDSQRQQPYAQKNDNKLFAISVNQFHSEFQSMSVISEDQKNKKYYLFVKGSPEVIISRCLSQEQNEIYLHKLHSFALKGYRVLGLGYKELSFANLENFIKLQRSEQEKDICFSGFLIFKNNLKKDTKRVITELRSSDLRIKVISGDNPITTIKIAEEACILSYNQQIVLIDCHNAEQENLDIYAVDNLGSKTKVEFNGNQEQIVLFIILIQLNSQIQYCLGSIKQNFSFCMTGKAQAYFTHRLDINNDADQKIKINEGDAAKKLQSKLDTLFKLLVFHTQVFSRTSPEQKANVIKTIKQLNEVVCMVGDGANDCSAIREADIGISFSDADGQFSAPYVSKSPSIGRAVLSTSKEIFKGYIQIGILRQIGFYALTFFYSGLSDFQLTWQGYVFGYTIIFILYGLSRPVDKLQKVVIDDDFFGRHTLISMMFSLAMFSSSLIVTFAILLQSSSYIATTSLGSDQSLVLQGHENTLVFIQMIINYLYIYLSNYKGKPIKQPLYKNIIFLAFILIQGIYANLILFTSKLQIKPLGLVPFNDIHLELKLFFAIHGFGLMIYFFDLVFTKNLFFQRYQRQQQTKQEKMLFDLQYNLTN